MRGVITCIPFLNCFATMCRAQRIESSEQCCKRLCLFKAAWSFRNQGSYTCLGVWAPGERKLSEALSTVGRGSQWLCSSLYDVDKNYTQIIISMKHEKHFVSPLRTDGIVSKVDPEIKRKKEKSFCNGT